MVFKVLISFGRLLFFILLAYELNIFMYFCMRCNLYYQKNVNSKNPLE